MTSPETTPRKRWTARTSTFEIRPIAGQALRLALLALAVSFAAFALVDASPIDPLQANVGQAALANMSEAKRAQLASYWNADASLLERWAHWLSGILHGDFGISLRFNAPVSEVIASRFASSFALMAIAWAASGLIGTSLGIMAALFEERWPDRLAKGLCCTLASTPSFWLGLVALTVFSVELGWFPLGLASPIGIGTEHASASDMARHIALPALVLSIAGIPNIALHTRAKTIDVLSSDYVRFARTRGESTGSIVVRHGLRNLALPALTLQFASVSELFGGSVLVEQVFSYPGLGQAAVTAGLGGDASLLAGIAVVSAVFVFFGNLAANVLYGALDPRTAERTKGRIAKDPNGREAGRP